MVPNRLITAGRHALGCPEGGGALAAADVEHALAGLQPCDIEHRLTEQAAQLAPTAAVEAVMAWLDAGQPDREQAAERIGQALDGIIRAAQPLTG
jgi:hypothetical protein